MSYVTGSNVVARAVEALVDSNIYNHGSAEGVMNVLSDAGFAICIFEADVQQDPYKPTYPQNIRGIIEKLAKNEDLTFRESNDAVNVLRRMLVDISELLQKSHTQMQNSLMPVVAAAEYLQQINDNIAKDALR